jgi:hypothetical protein
VRRLGSAVSTAQDRAAVVPLVDPRDRWGTPGWVAQAPLVLLGRFGFDLDAAAEPGAAFAVRFIDARDDALVTSWRDRACPRQGKGLDGLPLVWLNPPFSKAAGGKARWAARAREQAETGMLVCVYLPAYGDETPAALDGEALTRIGLVGRVAHLPPPGIAPSTPAQHQHAIWILGPEGIEWPYPGSLAWGQDGWVGRRPVPRVLPAGPSPKEPRPVARLGSQLVTVTLLPAEARRLGFAQLSAMGAGVGEALIAAWATAPAEALIEIARDVFRVPRLWPHSPKEV